MPAGARFLTLHHPDGQVFPFDAGALCLELLVTGGAGERARFETWHDGQDVARWAVASRFALDELGLGPADVVVTPEELDVLRDLREAVWHTAGATIRGEPLPRRRVTRINQAAAGPAMIRRLSWQTGSVVASRPVTGSQLATEIARDAIETFGGPLRSRIRQCAASDCALVFADTSRAGARRWCAMERCGNRHKVREHRTRRRSS
jgi:predicted RNA-binding Zn ribbon-like protein